jgi:iron(III) transport system substrate-binding protein
VAGALLLSACNSSGGDADPASAEGQQTAAGCLEKSTPEWDKVVKAADSEGKVVMYATLLPEISARLERAFEKAYPKIDLQVRRIVGLEVNATLEAEKATGTDGADVVSHVNYAWMYQHLKDGYFVKPVGPASAGPEWKGTPNLKEGVFQVSLLTGIGIAYRTDMVKTPPKTYEDLLKAEYGNAQIGIANAEAASIADIYAWMQEKFGADYLTKLAAQKPKVYPTAVPTLEALLAGEISVNAFASSVGVAAAKAKGAPVEFVLPNPGWAPLNLSYMLSWSKRPNAAQVLFNFMACPAGQQALTTGNVSVLPNIPGTLGAPNAVTPANLDRMVDPAWIAKFYPQWADTFGR